MHGSEDKYGRIIAERVEFHPAEPLFIFRATDKLTPLVLRHYANFCALHGCSTEFYNSIIKRADDIQEWQRLHPELVKLPD